jgi:hypothetical protein
MWGVSGKVILGVRVAAVAEQQVALLGLLNELQAVEHIVHLEGDEGGLTAWFSAPRQAGDFIAYWGSAVYPEEGTPIRPLQPPGKYIAIRSDDMLSAQEWHMASEGMDTYSVCSNCREKGLHVLSTSVTQQRLNNPGPTRAVRFFCEHCQSVCDEPAMAPMHTSPFPRQVLEVMCRIPAGSLPLINRTIGFESFERCALRQPNDRAPGSDGQPREYC